MKVIIAGSRNINVYNIVDKAIYNSGYDVSEIVSGGAKGVDSLGEQYARRNGIDLVIFEANWRKYGKSGGFKRNKKMGDYAIALIAIWDGKSKGTKLMIDYMNKLKKLVYIYNVEK